MTRTSETLENWEEAVVDMIKTTRHCGRLIFASTTWVPLIIVVTIRNLNHCSRQPVIIVVPLVCAEPPSNYDELMFVLLGTFLVLIRNLPNVSTTS